MPAVNKLSLVHLRLRKRSEIVRLIDYLAGRSSGQTNHPFWYKRSNPYNKIGSATVADSVGDTAQPRYLPQQSPLGTSQYYTSPIYRPSAYDQNYETGLSRALLAGQKMS
jgi:hypothetical protein